MANRYDTASVAKFSPLSFQELSAAPLMQRQKHDQLIAQQEMLRQGLAKVDPLDVHMNEALNVKSGIENKLASQAELLSREGVNPNTQGDFLALNREYQNLVSPTGRLGQINAAKQIYNQNFKDYLEDAQKTKGWSRERALANWNKFSNQYTGFDNDKIANIGQLGAPKKVEVMDVLKDVKGLLGEQVVGEMKASGYSFQPGPDGSMVMVDRSGRRIETSNKPNLQHAQNLINQRLMGKEWQDSIRFEGEDTKNIYGQLTSGINAMLSNKVVDNRSENAQYIAPSTGGNGSGTPGGGVIINNDSTLKSDALNYTNYSDALNARKRLMKSNSPKDRAELADLEDLQRNADSKLKSNPKYKDLSIRRNQILAEAKKIGDANKIIRKPNMTDDEYIAEIEYNSPTFTGKNYVINARKLRNNLKEINKSYTEIKNAAWKDSSSSRHSYSYLPTNSEEQTNWNIYNKGVFNTLKGGNLANLLDVSSIHTTNGSKTNVSNTDVNNIQALLNGADEKSFTINSIKTYGSNKTPEVTMTFIPNKNAKEYTMDRRLFTDYNDYGGAEKPVTVTFRLKDFSNASKTGSAVGYKSLSGAITDFWKDKGGVNKITNNYQGAEVKDAFVKSEYSKYSNDELNKLRNIDEDANRALQIRYMEYQASKQ